MPADHGGEVGQWGRPYQVFNPKWRRRRKSEGEATLEALAPSDKIAELERAKRERNVFCRECRRYVPWKEAVATYERRQHDLWRVWWHKDCGTMLQEHNVNDMQLVLEERDGAQRGTGGGARSDGVAAPEE